MTASSSFPSPPGDPKLLLLLIVVYFLFGRQGRGEQGCGVLDLWFRKAELFSKSNRFKILLMLAQRGEIFTFKKVSLHLYYQCFSFHSFVAIIVLCSPLNFN